MTDRERFEAWVPPYMHLHQILCAWDAWQAAIAAAEADKWAAVRRCAEIVRTKAVSILDLSVKRGPFTIQDDATNSCAQNLEKFIKAEFPEAFK